MLKKKLKNLYSRINWKKIGLFSLILFAIISVVSIILVSLTFARDVNKSYSKEFGDKLQIEYNLMLPSKYDESKDLDVIKKASNSINGQLNEKGFQDYGIQYGLEKSCPESKVTYQTQTDPSSFDFGTFYLTFNINDPLLNFDKKLILKNVGKKNDKNENILTPQDLDILAKNQFTFVSSFNNNFNLRLQEATVFTIGSTNLNNNFTNNIPINSNNNVVLDDAKTGVLAKLPAPTKTKATTDSNEKSNVYWDLNSFQKEFVNNFSKEWSEKGNHSEIISGLGENPTYKDPKQTYIYWTDRSNLITRLQTIILFTYLYSNYKNNVNKPDVNFTPVQQFLSEKIYENFSIYEKDFAWWVINQNNIKIILDDLNAALTYDQSNNTEAKYDKLLNVLSNYYTTGVQLDNIPLGTLNNPEEKTQLDNYKKLNATNGVNKKFLYSWNLSKNPLLSKYIQTIDYANFFNYFTDNTEDKYKELNPNWKDDQNYVENLKTFKKDNYFAQNFKILPENFGLKANTLVDVLNNYKVEYSYFNNNLYSLASLNLNSSIFNPEVWKIATNYFDYLNLIEQPNLKAPIGLPSYISTFIGILAIIIIVGIVVSVLYRIPGLFASFVSLLTFSIGSLAFVELNLPFSFNVVFNLLIGSLSVYIPIIYLFDYFKIGIKRGLNITNSLIFSFKKFLKISIAINVTLLIIGLVFLFFGIVQLQTFGSILVIISLLSILFGTFLYFGIFFISIKMFYLNFKMNLFLTTKYVVALNKISNSKFKLDNIEISQLEDRSIISKAINLMIFRNNVKKNWMFYVFLAIVALMFIGLIIFLAIGAPFSTNFSNNNEIIIQSTTKISNSALEQLANKLGIKIFEINENVVSLPGKDAEIISGYEYVIISTNSINWQSFNTSLSTVDFKALGFNSLEQFLNSISIRENNNDVSYLLKDNLIKCLFISLAFLLVWSLVWLNVINVIPVFIILLFNILAIVGVMNITRLAFDLDSMIAGVNIFVYFSIITFLNLCNFKINYKFKEKLNKDEMNKFIQDSLKFTLLKNAFFNLTILVSAILMFLFMSSEFVWAIGLFILSLFVISLVNLILCINFFYFAIIIRQKAISDQKIKLLHKYMKKEKKDLARKDFDKVDEQSIVSLNKFK